MRRIYFYILFFFIQNFNAQNFEVEISNNKVGLNESFEITFTLDDNGSNFNPPPFLDFNILSGPSQSKSTSIVNGSISQKSSYTYVLRPKKIGVFTILPANIKVKGKTIGTRPITIQVVKGRVVKKVNTPQDKVSQNVHLEVYSSKSTCYVGEPVVLTYKIYFNLNIGNLNPQRIKYSDFWTEDVDVNSETKKVMYQNKSYNSALIKQVVLIPQSSGRKNIDNLVIDLVASLPTNRRDFFGMLSTQSVNYTLESNSISINVLPLPKDNQPANFSGAVGVFSLVCSLDKDSINVNESATYQLKIKGSGNLNLLTSPIPKFNNELEVFDPKQSDKINVTGQGISGFKSEDYLIVPRHPGIYNLNPIEFTYFNINSKKYVTLKSSEKQMKVGVAKFDDNDDYSQVIVNKEKINVINEDIKFIKTDYENSYLKSTFIQSSKFYILLFLPLFLFILSIIFKKTSINNYFVFERSVLNKLNRKIKYADLFLSKNQYEKFYSELLDALFLYIHERFKINQSNLNIRIIEKKLNQFGINKTEIVEYLSLIKILERYRYSVSNENDNLQPLDLSNRVSSVINKIEQKLL